MTVERLAIVNRGEAAMRALHAVAEYNREHGTDIRTVALHTEPDAAAWFVRRADAAYDLGPAMFLDERDGRRKHTYLDYDRLETALTETDADAAWVGWGFVSEHAAFARLCERLGITFVGPSSDVIDLLGNKIAAKRLAEEADVPVVPWSGGPVEDLDDARAHADRIGYPLVVKAAAGGGGRGIRLVPGPDALADAFQDARKEGENAFGDPTVFLERQVGDARHVEVQIIADRHGTTWAVGVRDCTVQRRRQKILEESSSTALSDEQEKALRDAGVRMAEAAGYTNAGTIEFLHDPQKDQSWFMEVNTRLQVEHPVTELTTGLDLVKLQLHVARDGRLRGEPPPIRGHAVEARMYAEDPERGFSPAPGRITDLRIPAGPGVRVETGLTPGDDIPSEFDAMIAKLVAYGADRPEALARLHRALAQSIAVVDGGVTNQACLLHLLDRPEMAEGDFDTGWVDRLAERGEHIAEPDPAAVLLAAVAAYDAELAADRERFHASARRGRPEASTDAGKRVELRYRDASYAMTVYRLDPRTYRIDTDDGHLDLTVDRLGANEQRVEYAGRRLRTVCHVQGRTTVVQIDGVPHRIHRDEGGILRSPSPGVVISLEVEPGDEVQADEPVLVLEAMKMETAVAAPYDGRVRSVEVAENVQVDAGRILARIERIGDADRDEGSQVTLPTAQRGDGDADPARRCAQHFDTLRGYLLGYDLDPHEAERLQGRYQEVCDDLPPDDPTLREREENTLDVFADLAALSRRERDPGEEAEPVRSPQEYLFTFLRSPERADEVLPEAFLQRLERALEQYGVQSLEPTDELEGALLWMYRAFQRIGELTPAVADILDRHLTHAGLIDQDDEGYRELLDRVVSEAQGRYPTVADLAREVRFAAFDRPVLERAREEVYREMDHVFAGLEGAADPTERERALGRLVDCPQPLRGRLLGWYRRSGGPLRDAVLEVRTRRYYRSRDVHVLRIEHVDDHPLAIAEYEHEGTTYHLVVLYGAEDDLPALGERVRRHLDAVESSRPVVVDAALWRSEPLGHADAVRDELAARLDAIDLGRHPHRFDVMVTALDGDGASSATQQFTFRYDDGRPVEQELYRNLHPMLGKRLGLWRLDNFRIERLPSAEDVYLFRGVAHVNEGDERLFALAEVRDLTPARDASGEVVAVPQAERMLAEVLSGIRRFQSRRPPGERLRNNLILLDVRPPVDLPPEVWRDVARKLAPAGAGLGIDRVIARGRVPDEETGELVEAELHVENVAEVGVVVRRQPPSDEPFPPMSEYRQRVLETEARGWPFPYELVRMLTPPDGSMSDFPAGSFLEHDLDDGRLVPVDRPPGENDGGVVVGTIRNTTEAVPEGMERVIVLSDPSRSLGVLAEPECRRLIAALDLADERNVPLEWFPVSAGARVSMDSGTENMDWIARVLRRIVEFTQAGGEINIVLTGINVGAQPYFNAEATMVMHTSGILVMVPDSAMVLTGKRALDFSGGVSAEDNLGIGGFERIMGPNGEGQYWAPSIEEACAILFRHYEHNYVVPGERFPRRVATSDPPDRDVRDFPHRDVDGSDFERVGDVFSDERNPQRKAPFAIRDVMRAVTDQDHDPMERWQAWRDAETAVVWDARLGGIPVCLLGFESQTLPRQGTVPADGPSAWTSGTLFPQSSKKVARAINAASGRQPVVVLANLSGFDGSPESMRELQLEFGAEIGRAVTNFRGPLVFCVISRYHGGAFVVFSRYLNEGMEVAAVEGSYASVLGGAPAAAVVFAREVRQRTHDDPRVASLREELVDADDGDQARLESELEQVEEEVHAEKLREVADEFDATHSIERAREVGSVDRIVAPSELRSYLIDALERGMEGAQR